MPDYWGSGSDRHLLELLQRSASSFDFLFTHALVLLRLLRRVGQGSEIADEVFQRLLDQLYLIDQRR